MAKSDIATGFNDNLGRVRNLVDIYQTKIKGTGQGRRPVRGADVLRAAVVLLHATMEDLIRSISMELLPRQGSDVLDRIPLAGTANQGRAEKFLLGRLSEFRGKKIDDVVAQSVEGYLERSNYNSSDALVAAIEKVGLNVSEIEQHLSSLQSMMERRHRIVHRADQNPRSGSGHHRARSIGVWQVNRWIEGVEAFGQGVLAQVD